MNRRGFLQAILAAAAAPAVVKAANLMPVKALESGVLVPETYDLLLTTQRFRRAVVASAYVQDAQRALNGHWIRYAQLIQPGDPVVLKVPKGQSLVMNACAEDAQPFTSAYIMSAP